ncbi:hypothetical protein CHS0354_007108, partial [Potamilus streckersoni]
MEGCAPPVGSYDPKELAAVPAVGFDKSSRFKTSKENLPGLGSLTADTTLSCSQPSLNQTPLKMQKPSKSSSQTGAVETKIKELEKEVKRLLKEKIQVEKSFHLKEEDMKKLEGRFHNAQTDRCALQARLAALDKELKEAQKSNDVLKSK